MALKELKTDLGKVIAPFVTVPITQRGEIPSIPISKNITKVVPAKDEPKKVQQKTLLDLYKDYTNRINTPSFKQTDNKKPAQLKVLTSPNGSLNTTSTIQITNNSLLFGRKLGGKDVIDNMKIKPKLGLSIIDNIKLTQKLGLDTSNNIKLINKTGYDVKDLMKVVDKKGKDVKNNIIIVNKAGIDVTNNIIVPSKLGLDVTNKIIVNSKVGLDVIDNVIVPPKDGLDVIDNTILAPKLGIDTNYISTAQQGPGLDTDYISTATQGPGLDVIDNVIVPPKDGLDVSYTTFATQGPGLDVSYISNIIQGPGLDVTYISTAQQGIGTDTDPNWYITPNQILPTINHNWFLNPNFLIPDFINNQSPIDLNKSFATGQPIAGVSTPSTIYNTVRNAPYKNIMNARLFTDADIAFRFSDLKPMSPITSTRLLPFSFTNTTIQNIYDNKSSNINGIQTTYKLGYNNDLPNGGTSGQPYIRRDIGQRWNGGFDPMPGCPVQFIRGGTLTHVERIAADVIRAGRFLTSPCGLLWLTLQEGLHLTNPKVETDPFLPVRWNRAYNVLEIPAAIMGASTGYHPLRYGIFEGTPSYELIATTRNTSLLNPISDNAPIPYLAMGNRMLQNWRLMSKDDGAFGQTTNLYSVSSNLINPIFSGLAGPNSVYGIGFTNIYTSKFGTNLAYSDIIQLQEDKIAKFAQLNSVNTNNKQALFSYAAPYEQGIKYNTPQTVSQINTGIQTLVQGVLGMTIPKIGLEKVITIEDLWRNLNNSNSDALPWMTPPTSTPDGREAKLVIIDNEHLKYNALRYGDLDDLSKVNISNNNRGTPNYGAFIDVDNNNNALGTLTKNANKTYKIPWSNVGKYYEVKYKTSTPLIYTDGVNSRGIPNTGEPDCIYYPGGLTPDIYPDLIDFLICNTQFRALLKSLSYKFNPEWSDIKYVGRPDPVYLYQGLTRTVDFSFIAAAGTEKEMGIVWKHLNELGQKVSPSLQGNKMVAPIYTLKIGNFINWEIGFLSSLSFEIDPDFTWEIDDYKLPYYVNVDCAFTIIGKESPSKGNAYFADHKFIDMYKEVWEKQNDAKNLKQMATIGKKITPNITPTVPNTNSNAVPTKQLTKVDIQKKNATPAFTNFPSNQPF